MVLENLDQFLVYAIYFFEVLSHLQLDFCFWGFDLLLIPINQNRQPCLLFVYLGDKICSLALDLLLEGTRTMRKPNEIVEGSFSWEKTDLINSIIKDSGI